MKLVLLKLLNSGIQARNSLKHFIVLLLIAITLCLCLAHLDVLAVHHLLKRVYLLLILVQHLLELTPCCDRLHRESLLPLNFLGQVSHLLPQKGVLSSCLFHLAFRFFELLLEQLLLLGFLAEHVGQQLWVLSDLLQLLGKISLVVNGFFKLGLVNLS